MLKERRPNKNESEKENNSNHGKTWGRIRGTQWQSLLFLLTRWVIVGGHSVISKKNIKRT